MKRALTAVLLALWLPSAFAQTRPTWQYSETASVNLTIRDKYGVLGGYEATFVVHTPDGLKLMKTVAVEGDEMGEVSFPDDFRSPAQYVDIRAGRYRWECVVGGEVVTKGSFSVSLTDDDGPKPRSATRRSRQGGGAGRGRP